LDGAIDNDMTSHQKRMIRIEATIRSDERAEREFEKALICLAAQGIDAKAAKDTLIMIYLDAIPGFNSTL
jgi:hypothetical protein